MKIIELKAENIKKLKAIEIKPTDNTIVISGKNGQGKTSVLDSIWFALGGKESLKDTSVPIREGEDHAQVRIDIGDYIITRNWTSNDTSYLKVENRDGAKYGSPQQLLDSFIGDLSFDPLEFARIDHKSQKDVLLILLNLSVDLEKLDSKYQETFNERTFIGRDYKSAKAQFGAMAEPLSVLPAKEVSIEDLSKELMQAIENNNVIKEIKQNIEEYQEEIRDIEKKIEELNDRKSKLQSLISKEKEIYDRSKIIDTDNIQAKISDAENLNNQIRQAERYFNKKKEVEKLDGSYRDKTSELEKIQSEKQSLILNAKMPIDNLGVDDDGVTYNNIPFSQLSSAEQLKVSLSIAMAMNPKLRVIRITDGSLLDSTNMEIIRQMANENDFQVWIERVDDTGKIGIYIEDGEIKESA